MARERDAQKLITCLKWCRLNHLSSGLDVTLATTGLTHQNLQPKGFGNRVALWVIQVAGFDTEEVSEI